MKAALLVHGLAWALLLPLTASGEPRKKARTSIGASVYASAFDRADEFGGPGVRGVAGSSCGSDDYALEGRGRLMLGGRARVRSGLRLHVGFGVAARCERVSILRAEGDELVIDVEEQWSSGPLVSAALGTFLQVGSLEGISGGFTFSGQFHLVELDVPSFGPCLGGLVTFMHPTQRVGLELVPLEFCGQLAGFGVNLRLGFEVGLRFDVPGPRDRRREVEGGEAAGGQGS